MDDRKHLIDSHPLISYYKTNPKGKGLFYESGIYQLFKA